MEFFKFNNEDTSRTSIFLNASTANEVVLVETAVHEFVSTFILSKSISSGARRGHDEANTCTS